MKQIILSKPPLACFAAALFVMSDVSPACADYKTTVLEDNPVGYWRLGESSGTAAANIGSLGDVGNGTYANITLGTTGALVGDANTAASFNGTSSTVMVPFNNMLNSTVFSIELWVNPSTAAPANYMAPVNSRVTSSYQGYTFYAPPNSTNSQWQFWTGNGSVWHFLSGPLLMANQWAHLVGTYDGTNMSFYVNGTQRATAPVVFVPNSSSALQVGVGGMPLAPRYYFGGSIDELAAYTNALSPARVLAHYLAGQSTSPPPLPSLNIQRTATTILINWSNGTLQQAIQPTGPWSDVSGSSPLDVGPTPTDNAMFYQVRQSAANYIEVVPSRP